jgi:hypothetical protein
MSEYVNDIENVDDPTSYKEAIKSLNSPKFLMVPKEQVANGYVNPSTN